MNIHYVNAVYVYLLVYTYNVYMYVYIINRHMYILYMCCIYLHVSSVNYIYVMYI